MTKGQNILFIMSDEHNPKMLGCYGHDQVKTPNLDRLAGRGTRFDAAYTNSPICIPARAAFATGRYAHQTRHWDNAMPYDGAVKGWGHRLQGAGMRVESIGKLHYRDQDLDTGFSREIEPMHVMDGIGQVWGSVRDPLPPARRAKMLNKIGPGESNYNRYDRMIADQAKAWLRDAQSRNDEKPWVLYLGFVAPHFPLVVPAAYYDLYPLDGLPERKQDPEKGHIRHPWIQRMDDFQQVDRHLTPDQRLMATAAYFGLCTYVDALIGEVLDCLDASGLRDRTLVVYTSDHGDNVGARGLWGKSNMYEESAGIPMILSGAGFAERAVCETPVSLLDSYKSILDATGLSPTDEDETVGGESLREIAGRPFDPERTVFGEYHAVASPSGAFMVRRGRYKFIYYADFPPELFDLAEDPEETTNRADDPHYAEIVVEHESLLRSICDPEKIDRNAKDDQNELTARFGGPDAAFNIGTPGATPVPGQDHE